MRTALIVLVAIFAAARPSVALAQAETDPRVSEGADFGPVLIIEDIVVRGNGSTAPRVIVRALGVTVGDALRAGDPRLAQARFKVLALGFFRDVAFSLTKGSARGRVILVVEVVERGTVVLDNLFFGTSTASPAWLGMQVSERNFFGTGLSAGGGLVYAAAGDHEGAEPQWATEWRVHDPSVLGAPIGVYALARYISASEPYRVAGSGDDTAASNFEAFPYRRAGGALGATLDVTPLSRVTLSGRAEWVRAELPDAPTRIRPDGVLVPVDLGLLPGASRVVTLGGTFDRDTRPDPILPYAGDRLVLAAELGGRWLGGSYDFGSVRARYQRWWSLSRPKHVVSMHLSAGLVVGDAPLYERLYVADFNRLLPPRALGLVVSTESALDILGTRSEEVTYGQVGGSAIAEYSYQLFRSGRFVYGGDLFVGAGVWALSQLGDLNRRDRALVDALPLDLVIDAGLRVDTEIGIFELTFANAFGRISF